MKPSWFSASTFEDVLKRYSEAIGRSFGEEDRRQRCIELLSDALHWMACNIHRISPLLQEARDRFLDEALGNEDPEALPDNAGRSARLGEALCFYRTDDTPEGCLTDLLADARHWCRDNGHDFVRIDAAAGEHFETELIEERLALAASSETTRPPSPGDIAGDDTPEQPKRSSNNERSRKDGGMDVALASERSRQR